MQQIPIVAKDFIQSLLDRQNGDFEQLPDEPMKLLIVSDGLRSVIFNAETGARIGRIRNFQYSHHVGDLAQLDLQIVVNPDQVKLVALQSFAPPPKEEEEQCDSPTLLPLFNQTP